MKSPFLPETFKKPHLLLKLMETDGMQLEQVWPELKTTEVCKAALRNNFQALKFVGPNDVQAQTVLELLTESPELIPSAPVSVLTEHFLAIAPGELVEAIRSSHPTHLSPEDGAQTWYEQALQEKLIQLGVSPEEAVIAPNTFNNNYVKWAERGLYSDEHIHFRVSKTDKAKAKKAKQTARVAELSDADYLVMLRKNGNRLKDIPRERRSMALCLAACSNSFRAFSLLPDTICRRDLFAQLLIVAPKMVVARPFFMITLDFIADLPDHAALELLRRRPLIQCITDRMITVDQTYMDKLTSEIAKFLVKLEPLNFAGLPIEYQTWELARHVFGPWFTPIMKHIKSDDFWQGLLDSTHYLPSLTVDAPEKYRPSKVTPPAASFHPIRSKPANAIKTDWQVAVHADPRKISQVRNPSDDLIECAILGDYRCASFIRLPKLEEKHLQLYAEERLNATRRPSQVIEDADLLELFRNELEDEHAVEYSFWKIDNDEESQSNGPHLMDSQPIRLSLKKQPQVSHLSSFEIRSQHRGAQR